MQADSATVISASEPLTPAKTPWLEAHAAAVALAAITATVGMISRGGTFTATTADALPGTGLFVPALCVAWLFMAAGFDAATGRIPKAITITGLLSGLVLSCLSLAVFQVSPAVTLNWLGAVGPTESAKGLLVVGGVGFIGVLFAGMGGGDMKLLAAVGALLGFHRGVDALICAGVVALVLAIVEMICRGRMKAVLRIAACHLLDLIYLRRWTLGDDRPATRPKSLLKDHVPMAVPLLAGVLLSWVPQVASLIDWLIRPD